MGESQASWSTAHGVNSSHPLLDPDASFTSTPPLWASHPIPAWHIGEDTRYGFTGNLYSALIDKGIKTFLDDEGLRKGDEISLALVQAIEGSRVSIVVFSQNYAASRWCLDELIKILDCMKLRRQLVVPVFYKIDPSMVRNQTGPYEKAMINHKRKLRDDKEKIKRWRSALYQAANFCGWHLEFGYEFQFIQNIVQHISTRLKDVTFLVSQRLQVILQGPEFKDDVGNREYSEVAAAPTSSKEDNGKAEASNGRIKRLLFFGYSSRRPEAAATATVTATSASASKVENGEAEDTNVTAKKWVLFGNSSWQYGLEDLLRGSVEVLGKGSIGTSYKAVLEDGIVVTVKRLTNVEILEKEFKEKIEILVAMAHENLLPLRGYYFSKAEKLLFYNYIPMGSLSELLQGKGKGSNRTLLSWIIRLGIALQAARAIEYIHSRGPNVCHGNIKSSNILLTESYDALVSDFGLACIAVPSSTRFTGYLAPEVSDPCDVSQKADIYSFGMLLMEILTGKYPYHSLLYDEEIDFSIWMKSAVSEEWDAFRFHDFLDETFLVRELAMGCISKNPVNRPSMSEVIKQMEELPSLKEHDDTHQHQF